MKNYYLTVGLEIHVEIDTKSKMFCFCRNNPADQPNTNICPVCLGLPGALPVPNLEAVEKTIKLGLALDGTIPDSTKWDRKNYYYPDLPKGYQISQYDEPLVEGGAIMVGDERIDLTRIHLEEDTGKSIHPEGKDYSLIDLNRAGAPLLEMVSEPVIHSASQAKQFCQEFQKILRHLHISNADMEKGQMRCEANISISPDKDKLGVKVEVKNLNSFKSVERAIIYEVERQSKILEKNGKIIQETRGWSQKRQETYSQRSKESAHDYRYFPEPDIPKISIKKLKNTLVKADKSELPSDRRNLLKHEYLLTEHEAEIMAKDRELFDYFVKINQKTNSLNVNPRVIASWMLHSKFKAKLSEEDFVTLLQSVQNKQLNDTVARQIAEKILEGEKLSDLIQGHEQLDESDIIKVVKKVLKQNQQAVQDYRNGKIQAFQFLFGAIMRESKGRIDSEKTKEILIQELK